METIVKIKTEQVSKTLSTTYVQKTSNTHRTVVGVNIITATGISSYSRGEIDDKINSVTPKRKTFICSELQTSFDTGGDIEYIENVTRNGIDLKPSIFSIAVPYVLYDLTKNNGSTIKQGDIIIINYL